VQDSLLEASPFFRSPFINLNLRAFGLVPVPEPGQDAFGPLEPPGALQVYRVLATGRGSRGLAKVKQTAVSSVIRERKSGADENLQALAYLGLQI
jgi:hypothetical protein